MHSPASVLILSRDPHLLRTRVLLLEREGYRVLSADSPSDLDSIEPIAPMDLLVLCHTLSNQEQDKAIKVANSKWPGVRTLALLDETGSAPAVANRTFHAMDGPGKFLQAVDRLVAHSLSAT